MFSPESMNFKTEKNRKSNGELVGYCNWKTMLQEDASGANRDGTGPGTIYSNSASLADLTIPDCCERGSSTNN